MDSVVLVACVVTLLGTVCTVPLDGKPESKGYYFGLSESHTLIHRNKREEDIHDGDYLKPCCSYEKGRAENVQQMFDDCLGEIDDKFGLVLPEYKEDEPTKDEEEYAYFRNRTSCFFLCSLQKLGAANEEGIVNNEEAIKFMKQEFPEMKDENAWAAVDKHCTKPNKNHVETFVCKTDSMDFVHCTHFVTDAACPENIQRESSTCDKYRASKKKVYGLE